MEGQQHQSVLLSQAVEALAVKPEGRYLDGTFGRGGHSRLILDALSAAGRLDVIDCDPEAIAVANSLAAADQRVCVREGGFEDQLKQLLKAGDVFDGMLFDFGVSSPQIDQPDRGFSFQHDGPLDMRMNNAAGMTAADWLNSAGVDEMKRVFWRYGEEKNATRIARKIAERRQEQPLKTTFDLADLVSEVNRRDKKHPATRVFQAIRIHINDELGQIERMLPMAVDALVSGGRLVIISFHSLEDRLVKRFFKHMAQPAKVDRRMPVIPEDAPQPVLRMLGKPMKAVEHDDNIRARSAIMRVAEKI